ncbi:MAG: DUF4982 domain-containing protein, partial [Lachnospiraceae bacterium]|nr:DUF4982 domain-containing protein [Lachnospiraceae bacterium]
FCDNWLFHFGDFPSVRNRWGLAKSGSYNQGPESSSFDDSDWEPVTLPHDFVFQTSVSEYSGKEFDSDNTIPAMEDVNNMHTTAGSFEKGVGWYRKHFHLPAEYEGKRIRLILDGVYRDARFYFNDFFLLHEPDGYTRIVIDLTDTAVCGGDNVLAIRCDAREAQGWFYEGGGIYRGVRLEVTERDAIEEVFLHTEPLGGGKEAKLILSGILSVDEREETELSQSGADRWTDFLRSGRQADYELRLSLKSPNGSDVTVNTRETEWPSEMWRDSSGERSIANEIRWLPGKPDHPRFLITGTMENPILWSPEDPQLYEMTLALVEKGEIRHTIRRRFGIRQTAFDPDHGFSLNGQSRKLFGVCCHQNHGGLGAAVPREVMRYRVRKLKEMGANAYRCAHYPMSEEFLTVCDEEGMLVVSETRLLSSSEEDLSVLGRMVCLARNHPCVILYSIGNEEAQTQATAQGARIAGTMIRHIRQLDPWTPVTMALLMLDMQTNKVITDYRVLEGISKQLDVAGYNYHSDHYEQFHREYPDQPFVCTEQGTFKSTRGCYETDPERCHLAVTEERPYYMLGAQRWRDCKPDWVSGLFLWTGFDYYGEPTPFAWPAISSQFGAMDLCGYPKDFYYFYKAWWTHEDVIHVYPDMNEPAGRETKYYVFSNAEEVELVLNGRSLGRKRMPSDDYLVWEGILSETGTMEAIGYREGREVMRQVNVTGDISSAQLVITEDYRENDVVIRKLAVQDREGHPVPHADHRFDIPAEWGELLGASNGDPSDHTPGRAGFVSTFHGLAQVIVREYDREGD